MEGPAPGGAGRRVIVGRDSEGRSCVLREDVSQARTVRANGAVIREIWRQERLPAQADDDGTREGEMAPMPPVHGASIRLFTLPPDGQAEAQADQEAPGTVSGQDNGGSRAPTLHQTASLYVITVVSGQAYLVLKAEEVLLRQGDSLVLPGSLHTWRNPFPEAAHMISAVFRLAK